MRAQAEEGSAEIAPPSREEIEGLCIVHLVATKGRSFEELADGLGLSREHARVLEDAVAPMVAAGRLEMREGFLSSTELGRSWLRTRLAELGVSPHAES